MTDQPEQARTKSNSVFFKGFVPGLVGGFVAGAFMGVIIAAGSGNPPKLDTTTNTAPHTEPRDEFPDTDRMPAEANDAAQPDVATDEQAPADAPPETDAPSGG